MTIDNNEEKYDKFEVLVWLKGNKYKWFPVYHCQINRGLFSILPAPPKVGIAANWGRMAGFVCVPFLKVVQEGLFCWFRSPFFTWHLTLLAVDYFWTFVMKNILSLHNDGLITVCQWDGCFSSWSSLKCSNPKGWYHFFFPLWHLSCQFCFQPVRFFLFKMSIKKTTSICNNHVQINV